jgi:DNA-binding NtrC family response regulator
MPVPSLRLAVTSGPDGGASCTSDAETVRVGTAAGNDLELTDPTVSRYHLELAAVEDGARVVDCGSTNGTWLGAARIERGLVPLGAELRIGQSSLRIHGGEPGVVQLHPEASFGELVGQSAVMRRLMSRLARIAESDAAVLLVGESGTGKELTAEALHAAGARSGGPFVAIDCGALSPSLVASELFGHERGAFTGADRLHVGAFERARGGTLLLDEIGELPVELQAHLLGALERQRIRRVGGATDVTIDARVIAATNRDLRAEVNVGRFRLDLYYRLAVVTVTIPPLREHPEDVALLVEHFLRESGYEGPVGAIFPPVLMKRLEAHAWPGNVRELRNLVAAMLVTGDVPTLAGKAASVAPPSLSASMRPPSGLALELDLPYKEARDVVQERFEAAYLQRLLARTRGNISRAAREAEMARSHLMDLMRKHGLR